MSERSNQRQRSSSFAVNEGRKKTPGSGRSRTSGGLSVEQIVFAVALQAGALLLVHTKLIWPLVVMSFSFAAYFVAKLIRNPSVGIAVPASLIVALTLVLLLAASGVISIDFHRNGRKTTIASTQSSDQAAKTNNQPAATKPTPLSSPSARGLIGVTVPGNSTDTFSGGLLIGSIYPARTSSTPKTFSFYVRGGQATQYFTPVVYDVVAGAPSHLLAYGSQVTVNPRQPKGWISDSLRPIGDNFTVAAGRDYFLGLETGYPQNGASSKDNGAVLYTERTSPPTNGQALMNNGDACWLEGCAPQCHAVACTLPTVWDATGFISSLPYYLSFNAQ